MQRVFCSVVMTTLLVLSSSVSIDYNTTAGPAELLNVVHEWPLDAKDFESSSPAWTMFKQCDSRWSGNRLGTCSLTICQAGCAMSSVAMMLNTKGAGTDPAALNTWLGSHGGYASGCNIVWGSVNAFGKVKYQSMQTASEANICAGLKAGHGIIANVNGGHHWVLLTGCRGGGVFDVNDPGYNRATYSMSDILREAVYH
jgi:hypothetical protein